MKLTIKNFEDNNYELVGGFGDYHIYGKDDVRIFVNPNNGRYDYVGNYLINKEYSLRKELYKPLQLDLFENRDVTREDLELMINFYAW